ncbi:hypothetical protein L6164_028421 [Bauhinia variegata]|uniref:Uncharacterized protein n=1 Tax=Bauhinia variegata TaxID=167791 RepID=A0ACB9L682_BAUVA|nr:hypothetical protein L6164_028421 [Bauhinia variegata]
MAASARKQEEYLDVLTETGEKTGISKPRGDVHRDGDYHRVVNTWIFSESTQELLLQQRAFSKDSWPGLWDVSSAGHIVAGHSSLTTARRELQEELGVTLPEDAFELIFVVLHDGEHHEFGDVYLVTTVNPVPLDAFILQEGEVSAVRYVSYEEYKKAVAIKIQNLSLMMLVDHMVSFLMYKENAVERSLTLQKQLSHFAPVELNAVLSALADSDREALVYIVKAVAVMDEIFHLQASNSNLVLRDWLKEHADTSELDKLKWSCYQINKGPWSSLDESKTFLTTADSAIRLLPEATRPVQGWKGLEYRAAFPMVKPLGANFYPRDMDKKEFEMWKDSLGEEQQNEATGFFSVIRRHTDLSLDSCSSSNPELAAHDLYTVPYSEEYKRLLEKASELLHKAGDTTASPSLKKLLHSKADAFLSNDYYESDIAWLELDSKLDVTIGPYMTYEDQLFGYKATFEAYVGVRDDEATAQLKLFGDNLQVLEQNLPLDDVYKSKEANVAPIRVIQLIYNAANPGAQAAAFNLPNDERIVKRRGTSMVMIKNASEAKFKFILQLIAEVCLKKGQQELVDFETFFTHIICHECCHGIGPHTITLPNGQKSSVRLQLQEFHSALEEAKADIVGLWALRFLISQGLLSKRLFKYMYVSFLAGCFASVRFGLKSAHGKAQALQFNWLYEKGAYVLHSDDTFSVDFTKVSLLTSNSLFLSLCAVESLSREILTIQAKGDKEAAGLLLGRYAVISEPLKIALKKLEKIQVPVDIAPTFPSANKILE